MAMDELLGQRAASGAQRQPGRPRTITAAGADVELAINEVPYTNGGVTIYLDFRNKSDQHVLLHLRARVSAQSGEYHLVHEATDNMFSYRLEIIVKPSDTPDVPAEVYVSAHVKNPDGSEEKFGLEIGPHGPLANGKAPPGLDTYLSQDLEAKLKPLEAPVSDEVSKYREPSKGSFPPPTRQQPHSWLATGCRAVYWGVGTVGAAVVCGGTSGIGCMAALFAIGAATSAASDQC